MFTSAYSSVCRICNQWQIHTFVKDCFAWPLHSVVPSLLVFWLKSAVENSKKWKVHGFLWLLFLWLLDFVFSSSFSFLCQILWIFEICFTHYFRDDWFFFPWSVGPLYLYFIFLFILLMLLFNWLLSYINCAKLEGTIDHISLCRLNLSSPNYGGFLIDRRPTSPPLFLQDVLEQSLGSSCPPIWTSLERPGFRVIISHHTA